MSEIIRFPSKTETKIVAPNNREYRSRLDHVLLSAAFHGLIKNDHGALRILLNAVLRQDTKPLLDLSVQEAQLVEAASYQELFEELYQYGEE